VIHVRFKACFFDRPAVIRRTDDATRKVLSRFGAYVRQTARKSIRKDRRKRPLPSRPGQPPYSRTGLLKEFIFFGYDGERRSVVIGPARLNGRSQGNAPSVLEYGGTTTVSRFGRRRTVRIAPRPYMGPAFEKEQSQLPALWQNSVTR
jgi:hypothetical protein